MLLALFTCDCLFVCCFVALFVCFICGVDFGKLGTGVVVCLIVAGLRACLLFMITVFFWCCVCCYWLFVWI